MNLTNNYAHFFRHSTVVTPHIRTTHSHASKFPKAEVTDPFNDIRKQKIFTAYGCSFLHFSISKKVPKGTNTLKIFAAYCCVVGLWYLSIKEQEKLEEEKAHNVGLELRETLEKIKNEGSFDWQKQSMRLIEKARFENHTLELARLRGCGILTDGGDKQFSRMSPFTDEKSDRFFATKVVFFQGVEIKKIYQNSHHVFTHGQYAKLIVLSLLNDELIKITKPNIDLEGFTFLRPPYAEGEVNMRLLQNRLDNDESVDYRSETKNSLLSVDAYMINKSHCESAFDFMARNNSMGGFGFSDKPSTHNAYDRKILDIARENIKKFSPSIDEHQLKNLINKVSLASKIAEKSSCGNFAIICLPKEKSYNMQYRAHPLGRRCDCHPKSQDLVILEKVQLNILDNSTECSDPFIQYDGEYFPVPQYRLFIPKLKPGEGTQIYLLSSIPKRNIELIKSEFGMSAKEALSRN